MGLNDHMSTSDAGIDLIKRYEGKGKPGKPFQAYYCDSGKPTIGWGHTKTVTASDVATGYTITEAKAQDLLTKDIVYFEMAIERHTKVELNQNQYDALVAFTYNCGTGALKKVLKFLHRKGPGSVPGRLMLYIKYRPTKKSRLLVASGLVRRRRDECALWRNIDQASPTVNIPQSPQMDPGNPIAVVKSSGTFWAAITGLAASIGQYVTSAFDFAGAVTVETQHKLSLTQALYSVVGDHLKEILVILAVAGAIGVIWRRMSAEKERRIA